MIPLPLPPVSKYSPNSTLGTGIREVGNELKIEGGVMDKRTYQEGFQDGIEAAANVARGMEDACDHFAATISPPARKVDEYLAELHRQGAALACQIKRAIRLIKPSPK